MKLLYEILSDRDGLAWVLFVASVLFCICGVLLHQKSKSTLTRILTFGCVVLSLLSTVMGFGLSILDESILNTLILSATTCTSFLGLFLLFE